MASLSTWTFTSPDGAEQAMRVLARLQDDRVIGIQDASVVSWPRGRRKPRTRQARDLAGPAALSGAFWGLLFGILFLLPVVGRATGAAVESGAGMLSPIGLSDEFLQSIREQVTPGSSALFLLTTDEGVARIRDAFAGVHAELLTTDLSADQEAALRTAFDDGDGPEIRPGRTAVPR
jgi:uncharacterized membrane protein